MKPQVHQYPIAIPSYYSSRLNKLNLSFYDFITYLPFELQTLSDNLSQNHDFYELHGKAEILEKNSKYVKFFINTNDGLKTLVFDWAKKLNFDKYPDATKIFRISKKNDFFSLDGIFYEKVKLTYPILLPKYRPLSYQIRSKQINTLHQKLESKNYILNLTGLIPKELGIDLEFNLLPLHKPNNKVEFDNSLYNWFKIQAFLNLAYLRHFSSINSTKTQFIEDSTMNIGKAEFIKIFETEFSLKLSNTQTQTIIGILDKITK